MHAIPCYTDSDANRFPEEVEEESPLSLSEQHIEWIFSEWQDAIKDDSYGEWKALRMMLYGATQALNQCGDFVRLRDDRQAIKFLSDVAFQHGLDCIAEGKYAS